MMAATAKTLLVIILTILISSCASFPQWSEQPQDCSRWDEGLKKDVYSAVKKQLSRKYICVEYPEVVKLPSYIQLLQLPPAEEKPVVAVYNFLDKTGQRKSVENIASFSTAVTQGATEMVIDALKTAGGGTWFRVVERNGIDNLVRERQIIRSARKEFNGEDAQNLNPLLFTPTKACLIICTVPLFLNFFLMQK